MTDPKALFAARAEAERLGYGLIDDRIFAAYERALGETHPLLCAAVFPGPSRCPGTIAGAFPALGATRTRSHACIHPARMPDGVEGRCVHRCECGMSWEVRS